MSKGFRSKPVYTELVPDRSGIQHLLVGEGQGAEALLNLCRAWQDDAEQPVYDIFYYDSADRHWVSALNEQARDAVAIFTSQDSLVNSLKRKLAAVHMGTRLYVAGNESFIWTVVNTGRAAGMEEDTMQMQRCGTLARPTICVHCQTRQTNITTNIYQCPGCGCHVFVRDHFSRRLGAYQAVCVDAENPGVLPPVEELYP